jgi:collagenase-like PrtC family protease
MASFRIPCNWDPALLDALDGVEVSNIYGMVPSHVAGGGRPSAALPQISQDAARDYIREARSRGYSFNYLFNAACLDGLEFTEPWRKAFLEHLDWAVDAGADAVTVAIPYMVEEIKRRHPHVKVCVSSFARVNGVRRAVYFEQLGADDITLDPVSMNRSFACLAEIARAVDCTLTLIANGLCLYECPFAQYHAVLMAHSSQDNHPSRGRYEEYPFYNCTLHKLRDPAELVRAGFIRPDDLGLYEAIGISSFKLVDRTRPTAWLARMLEAYAAQRYDGDLLEIVNFPHFFLSLLYKQADMEGEPVYPRMDNRALDGFLERVRDVDCVTDGCEQCHLCDEYAKRAVETPEGVERLAGVLEQTLSRLSFA